MKKTSYKEKTVSTGRVEKGKPSTMDQLFGTEYNKFGTLDYSIYQAKLDEMTLGELQDEARKINCPPLDDKERLKRSLKNEFRIYVSNYYVPVNQATATPSNIPKVVKDLMAEGR